MQHRDEALGDARIGTITALFAQHADSVYHVAWRVLWSQADAEDVTQTTFLRAFTRLDQLRDPGRAKPWLLQIAYRAALEVVRARRVVPTAPEGLADLPDAFDVEELVARREVIAALRSAIDGLPEGLRIAFVLRDVEGLAVSDVASTLGIGVSAAKMRVSRAREQLRVALKGAIK